MPAATCLGCGCACDDIDLVVDGGRIVEARGACAAGARWFGDGSAPRRAVVRGADVALDAALDAAAALLSGASAPLVYLVPELSCEAQREGVAIADLLRARIDSITSSTAMRPILAAQERGRASATLGEIRNRADVVVFWGVDPGTAYPRFTARYAPEPAGVHLPRGRRDRVVVAVDVGDRRGPEDADHRHRVAAADEVAALAALGAGAGELSALLRTGRYVAIVADAETDGGDPARAGALIALAQSLNATTRCALSLLRGGGNRTGADACLTWQTGFPMAVDFARGAPRYRPHDGNAAVVLAQGLADAVLVLGAAGQAPATVASAFGTVPAAVVGPRASETPGVTVAIDTALAGVHEAGTALRMDDVPLPLRAAVPGPPAARTVLAALRARVAAGERT